MTIQIKSFLKRYEIVSPEDFDNICHKYMMKSASEPKEKSEAQVSDDDIILYRGFYCKKCADDFRKASYFVSPWNVRGCGIYTTTSLDFAKSYSDKNISETFIKMSLSKSNSKILDNDYL